MRHTKGHLTVSSIQPTIYNDSFNLNVYRFMELRLYQARELHRVSEPDVVRILPQQGDNTGMWPLVGPPGRHADHRRLGMQHSYHFPGGGGQAGVVRYLQNVAGSQGVVVPYHGIGVTAQDDLLPVIVEPLTQARHVHAFTSTLLLPFQTG